MTPPFISANRVAPCVTTSLIVGIDVIRTRRGFVMTSLTVSDLPTPQLNKLLFHMLRKVHLAALGLLLALLAGCGGRPKPSEADVRSAISAELAGIPLTVAKVNFDRREVTGDTAALTFEVTYRNAFDLYERDSLDSILAKRGKSRELASAPDLWAQLKASPHYERLRTQAGLAADAAPVAVPRSFLRLTTKADNTLTVRAQARAHWDGFKWLVSDLQHETRPVVSGQKRGDYSPDLPVLASDRELDPLIEKLETQMAVVGKLRAAGAAIVSETLTAFADSLKPGLVLGGNAYLSLTRGQPVSEGWTLEILSRDPAQRRFTALLRGDAPWHLARAINGEWNYELGQPGVAVALHSTAEEAVPNAGPVLSSRSNLILNLNVGPDGWKAATDRLTVTLAPLDASAIEARRLAVIADLTELRTLLVPGVTWPGVCTERGRTEQYEWRIESVDHSTGLVRASLASAGHNQHRREFTGTLEANRYRHDGWPLRLVSTYQKQLKSREVGGAAVARNLGSLLFEFSDVSIWIRAMDGVPEMKSNRSEQNWRLDVVGGGTGRVAARAGEAGSGFVASPVAPAPMEDTTATAPVAPAVPTGWDGISPVLKIGGEERDVFLAKIKISQSAFDLLRGSASVQIVETRPLPVLPASGWQVLMGGETALKTGTDGPTLSLVSSGKVNLEKVASGLAAVPMASRVALRVTRVSAGAWLAPRSALSPGTYALLVDTACFAFEVR